jgi:Ni,Fe-hydrogenase I large subunit
MNSIMATKKRKTSTAKKGRAVKKKAAVSASVKKTTKRLNKKTTVKTTKTARTTKTKRKRVVKKASPKATASHTLASHSLEKQTFLLFSEKLLPVLLIIAAVIGQIFFWTQILTHSWVLSGANTIIYTDYAKAASSIDSGNKINQNNAGSDSDINTATIEDIKQIEQELTEENQVQNNDGQSASESDEVEALKKPQKLPRIKPPTQDPTPIINQVKAGAKLLVAIIAVILVIATIVVARTSKNHHIGITRN